MLHWEQDGAVTASEVSNGLSPGAILEFRFLDHAFPKPGGHYGCQHRNHAGRGDAEERQRRRIGEECHHDQA